VVVTKVGLEMEKIIIERMKTVLNPTKESFIGSAVKLRLRCIYVYTTKIKI